METAKMLQSRIDIPLDKFSRLIKENCSEELNENNCLDLVVRNMFYLYSHFSKTTSSHYIYASKGLCKEDSMLVLDSPAELRPYRKHLEKSSAILEFDYSIDYNYFVDLCNTVFHGNEIQRLENKKISARDNLDYIAQNALALYYWVNVQILDRKRIGVIGCRDGKPNPQGFFRELELNKIICNYDAKKSYCLEEEDFLFNASPEEIGERLVDLIGDFNNELNDNGRTALLYRYKSKIEYYSLFVGWNSADFFKEKLDTFARDFGK